MQVTTLLLPKMFSKPCFMVIQNAKVACISIGTGKATLSPCTTIPNISQYHSFEFHHDHMIMWRYFGIGELKRWNYTNIFFTPNITMVLPFSSATSGISEGVGMSKKEEMTELYVIYTSVLGQDVWIPSKM